PRRCRRPRTRPPAGGTPPGTSPSTLSSRSPFRRNDETESQQIADFALATTHLGAVELVLAQHLRAELARREGEDGGADQREQQVAHVGGAEPARAHALAQESAHAAEDALDGAVALELLRRVAGEVVVLEQRAQQQARVGGMVGEQVAQVVEPA